MKSNKFLLALTALSLVYIGLAPTSCGGKVNVDPSGTTTTGGGSPGGGGQGAGGIGAGGTGAGGTGAGGTTSTGGTMNTGDDLCPGDPYTLGFGDSKLLSGDTSMANGDYSSFCDADSGPENVYALTFANSGTLAIVLTSGGDGLDPALYLRRTCDDNTTTVFCRDLSTSKRDYLLHVDSGTYYLFVDGEDQSSGSYLLNLAFADATCGDGVTNPHKGEQCDDGNMDLGDGCDASCQLEPAQNDDCSDPQGPIAILAGFTNIVGTTLGNSPSHHFDFSQCGFGGEQQNGVDRVVALAPQVSGTMNLKRGFDATGTTALCTLLMDPGCWLSTVHVRTEAGDPAGACSKQSNQIACGDPGVDPGYVQDITFPVTAGEVYYVFLDTYWDGGGEPTFVSGPYNLNVTLTP
jgi:cysteine-rich repeat protein